MESNTYYGVLIQESKLLICPSMKKLFRVAILVLWALGFSCIAVIKHEQLLSSISSQFGTQGALKLSKWESLLNVAQSQQERQKVVLVNQFFNANTRFEDDIIHWKKNDYWATPLETLGSGAGDCEDFAIAKYQTLLLLGIPTSQLRLIYVKAQIGGLNSRVYQAHMVLGYYPTSNAIPLILDSLVTEVASADKRPDLVPVFSFNGEGLWVGNQIQSNADPSARLSRWRELLERMHAEGF